MKHLGQWFTGVFLLILDLVMLPIMQPLYRYDKHLIDVQVMKKIRTQRGNND